MLISCILAAADIGLPALDLIVLPEGVAPEELDRASAACPDAIVAAALAEDGGCRGYLIEGRRNQIDYWKVETDGVTLGSGDVTQSPLHVSGDLALALLICKDADPSAFSQRVLAELRAAQAPIKVLCIPADMQAMWFSNTAIPPMFEGVHVALCNHTLSYQGIERRQSFIANPSARKIVVQENVEPIQYEIAL